MMVPLFLEVPALALNLASKLVAHGLAHRAPSRAKTLVHLLCITASLCWVESVSPEIVETVLVDTAMLFVFGTPALVRISRRLDLSLHLCWYTCFLVDVLELRWVRFLS